MVVVVLDALPAVSVVCCLHIKKFPYKKLSNTDFISSRPLQTLCYIAQLSIFETAIDVKGEFISDLRMSR